MNQQFTANHLCTTYFKTNGRETVWLKLVAHLITGLGWNSTLVQCCRLFDFALFLL